MNHGICANVRHQMALVDIFFVLGDLLSRLVLQEGPALDHIASDEVTLD